MFADHGDFSLYKLLVFGHTAYWLDEIFSRVCISSFHFVCHSVTGGLASRPLQIREHPYITSSTLGQFWAPHIIRNIFWGVGAIFKNIKPWFMKKFISLLIVSSILQQYLLNVSSLPPLNLQSVSTSSFCLRPPHPPLRAPSMSSFVPGPPTPP